MKSVGNRELQSALKLHLKMKVELNFTQDLHVSISLNLVSWSANTNRHKLNPLYPAGTRWMCYINEWTEQYYCTKNAITLKWLVSQMARFSAFKGQKDLQDNKTQKAHLLCMLFKYENIFSILC